MNRMKKYGIIDLGGTQFIVKVVKKNHFKISVKEEQFEWSSYGSAGD
jgi:hypothetical protein